MSGSWSFLGTPEFWTNAAVGVLGGVLATFIVEWLRKRSFARFIPRLLQANALLVASLGASPYSGFVMTWFMDLMVSLAFAGIYIAVSVMPSLRLHIFALLGPNLLMVVMVWAYASSTVMFDWRSVIAFYPMVFVFFALPVMIGVVVVARQTARHEQTTAA